MAIPPLQFSLAPSSSASSGTGLDMFGAHGGGMTGAINVGSGAGTDTWVTGLVRDLAIGAAVALAARYLWGQIK